jgi:hypothetical protein
LSAINREKEELSVSFATLEEKMQKMEMDREQLKLRAK